MDSATQILDQHLTISEGFPYPDWKAIAAWRQANVEKDEWNDWFTEIANDWVGRIGDAFGVDAVIYESPNFLFLSAEDEELSLALSRGAEKGWNRVRDALKGMDREGALGINVILLMPDDTTYWRYLSHFNSDEEAGDSAGVLVSREYPHIVLYPRDIDTLGATLLQELVCLGVAQLRLPRWLSEGLVSSVRVALGNRRPLQMTTEHAELHFNFWNEENIQRFWSGAAFQEISEARGLSYPLAEIFVRNILEDVVEKKSEFIEFVRNAKREDAGEAAAVEFLGGSLGEIASIFLGEGNWAPVRQENRELRPDPE